MGDVSDIVIVGAARTPLGAFNGQFKHTPATQLGADSVAKALSGLPADEVSELSFGCVLPAGLGQAPARRVASLAGLPLACSAATINKACGSGLKTIESVMHSLNFHGEGLYIAGGMENMSLAPHLMLNSREGYRLGAASLEDHLFIDGLIDASTDSLMGEYAEQTAHSYGFDRLAQDEYAQESLRRAQATMASHAFKSEIAGVHVPGHKDLVAKDEIPNKLDVANIPRLKPAFREGGTVTAANASSLADGAAALALCKEGDARANGYKIIARIKHVSNHSQEPEKFTTAPIPAIQKLLDAQCLTASDIDLWEVNEAFAVVPMSVMKALRIDHGKLNIGGGACALGHPLGATGTRIVVTLLAALEREDLTLGVASLCIGGGEGMAILLERVT